MEGTLGTIVGAVIAVVVLGYMFKDTDFVKSIISKIKGE
jgi:hypothetical protein